MSLPQPARPTVVLATRNPGKTAELRRILAAYDVDLVALEDAAPYEPGPETGPTFAENALAKAREAAAATGLPAVADDSGLCVDALQGMPGVLSARWAGRHGDDAANLRLVLDQVTDVPDERRGARFVCAAAYALPDGREAVVEGVVEGRLTTGSRGDGGFGYDPVFVPGPDGRTMAELGAEEKDAISHRGRALRALAPRLAEALRAGQPTTVAGDTALQSDVLEDLAGAARYRRWLVDLALPWLGADPLEVGSGLGHYAADWVAAGVPSFTASEADAGRLAALQARFAGDPVVRVRELSVPVQETAAHSAVVAFNVLEHVPDDVGALRDLTGLLRPGGLVVLVVPAFPSAMSEFDRSIGHQRRYRRRSLRAAAEAAGLQVLVLHHVNCVGLLGWYVLVKALHRRPGPGPALLAFDRGVVPWLRRLEARRPPPFGQSLFLVARRP